MTALGLMTSQPSHPNERGNEMVHIGYIGEEAILQRDHFNDMLEACRAFLHHHEQTYDGESLDTEYAHALQLAERAIAHIDGKPAPMWNENLAYVARKDAAT